MDKTRAREVILGLLPTVPTAIPTTYEHEYHNLLREGEIELIFSPDGEEWVRRCEKTPLVD